MNEYTPTTDEMRFAWAERVNKHDQEGADEFDRWLAEVERAAAARALEEVAGDSSLRASGHSGVGVRKLLARAAEIREGKSE